jgi:hypothetical protein
MCCIEYKVGSLCCAPLEGLRGALSGEAGGKLRSHDVLNTGEVRVPHVTEVSLGQPVTVHVYSFEQTSPCNQC